jgi:pyridoxal 5'-phosphate synthase pdxS subunit
VSDIGTMRVKSGLADMLKGGVIMDVTNAEQAKIAEDAGACAVMALERVPSDIRAQGGVARMADPTKIQEIQACVSVPVMAKARIGHFVEAQILESLEVDYIDESEVLTPADEANHINKWKFNVPFVCGAVNLGEALRRISEGAAMIRTKGEAGTGDVVEAVRHMRTIMGQIRHLQTLDEDELYVAAKELQWRRRCVRGLRHLQERGSAEPRQRDRQGGHQLSRRQGPRRGERGPGRRHARDRRRTHAGRSQDPAPRLVSAGAP